VPDRVKPSFVIFYIRALRALVMTLACYGALQKVGVIIIMIIIIDAHGWASECLDVKSYKWRLNLVWHTA